MDVLNRVREAEWVYPFRDPDKVTSDFEEHFKKQSDEDRDYFTVERGLSEEIVERYRLFVANIFSFETFKRAVIPYWNSMDDDRKVIYFVARSLSSEDPKYRRPKHHEGHGPFFNEYYLKELPEGTVIYLTEGEFDALSIETLGLRAISLGSAQNVGRFLEKVRRLQVEKKFVFVSALDNDEAGRSATEELVKALKCQVLEIPREFKDVNEWLVQAPESFRIALYRPHSIELFLMNFADRERMEPKPTGFRKLDSKLNGGLYEGLYVLGGIPALGKTTFVSQLADQLAERGEHVLFFSLEQSRFELVSKSLARLYNRKSQKKEGSLSLRIRRREKIEFLSDLIREYRKFADRISIVEGNLSTTVEWVRGYVRRYIALNNVKPIVIIDYLQVLQTDEESTNVRQRIDTVVTELKRLSRDLSVTVIVVSSFNREAYDAEVSFKSFKESGGIEYTADVVMGLDRDKKGDQDDGSRQLKLVILKNRYGVAGTYVNFNFYPAFDLFEEDEL